MQKINLFVNYYQCDDLDRQKELDYCKKNHKESGYFNEVISFSERPTYNDFFNATKNYPNDINILCNSDIYFNETILEVRGIKQNEVYALTRWEEDIDEDGNLVLASFEQKHSYNNEAKSKHSQDVWVINGSARNINGYFHIGVPGCDNRIAHEFHKAYYDLKNPSDRIKCVHKHKDEKRNYKIPNNYPNGRVPPPYKFVLVDGVNQVKGRFRI